MGVAEEREKASAQKSKPEMTQNGGKKPNRVNDLKEKRNGRKTWNRKQLSVDSTQRKRQ